MLSDSISVGVSDVQGKVLGNLEIAPARNARPEALLKLLPADASALGEEAIQLVEQQQYTYRVRIPGLSLAAGSPDLSIATTALDEPYEAGLLRISSTVGRLVLVLRDASGRVGTAAVEVRSAKVGYRDEYRLMVRDIAQECANLLAQVTAPGQQRHQRGGIRVIRDAARDLGILDAIVANPQFRAAVARVIANPNRSLVTHQEKRDIACPTRLPAASLRSLRQSGQRVIVPELHPMHSRLAITRGTLPRRVQIMTRSETTDTDANRYVRHIISVFHRRATAIARALARSGTGGATLRASTYAAGIARVLDRLATDPFFQSIGNTVNVPRINATTALREDYRVILGAWATFVAASSISWHELESDYSSGQRDLDTLYEYWCFFQVMTVMREVFALAHVDLRQLMRRSTNGFDLALRRGVRWSADGTWHGSEGELAVRFYYNMTFPQRSDPNAGGSWSATLRPDFTVAYWRKTHASFESAVRGRGVRYLHFDAKYRRNRLGEILGEVDGDTTNSERGESAEYVTSDLMKMHAYRDAIRGTLGSYVLFPGDRTAEFCINTTGGFPRVGAIALRPHDPSNTGRESIRELLTSAATFAGRDTET